MATGCFSSSTKYLLKDMNIIIWSLSLFKNYKNQNLNKFIIKLKIRVNMIDEEL